jgi:hypothetical protein
MAAAAVLPARIPGQEVPGGGVAGGLPRDGEGLVRQSGRADAADADDGERPGCAVHPGVAADVAAGQPGHRVRQRGRGGQRGHLAERGRAEDGDRHLPGANGCARLGGRGIFGGGALCGQAGARAPRPVPGGRRALRLQRPGGRTRVHHGEEPDAAPQEQPAVDSAARQDPAAYRAVSLGRAARRLPGRPGAARGGQGADAGGRLPGGRRAQPGGLAQAGTGRVPLAVGSWPSAF